MWRRSATQIKGTIGLPSQPPGDSHFVGSVLAEFHQVRIGQARLFHPERQI
jgi:hypothetical protein